VEVGIHANNMPKPPFACRILIQIKVESRNGKDYIPQTNVSPTGIVTTPQKIKKKVKEKQDLKKKSIRKHLIIIMTIKIIPSTTTRKRQSVECHSKELNLQLQHN